MNFEVVSFDGPKIDLKSIFSSIDKVFSVSRADNSKKR
jgi:hypothetical protein